MDRNLYTDNFEELLREKSDEFKMYPTKRVWYSIYNNIHPGKKWPSIAMSITLIGILLLVGYLNTNNENDNLSAANLIQTKQPSSANLSTAFNSPFLKIVSNNYQTYLIPFAAQFSTPNLSNPYSNNLFEVLTLLSDKVSVTNIKYNHEEKYNIGFGNSTLSGKNSLTRIIPLTNNELTTIAPIRNQLIVGTLNNKISYFINEKNISDKSDVVNLKNNLSEGSKESTVGENLALIDLNDTVSNNVNMENKISFTGNNVISLKTETNLTDGEKEWIENYALYNRPAPKKWIGKLGWQTYITPSVVYRNLKSTITNDRNINNEVIQRPSFGLEIGRGLIYALSNGVKLKTGLQLNFTRYNAEAFGNSHPVATTITLHSSTGQPYQEYKSTPFSNNNGITPIKLHNETFQISIPIGMDVKIAGNENLQWNMGATIQPSYIFAGKSYLISSDRRNYIKEAALLNRWNLNAGFETFITYKINSFTLQLGPQFRKQLFTTNTKQYSVQEKLTNYGFKFGITKLIK